MVVQRERYVIMRNNRTEILCKLFRNHRFVNIKELKDISIKIYHSKKQAENAMRHWSDSWLEDAEVVRICETIKDCE